MNRLITVKGTGNVSVKTDLIIITMNLESQQLEYDQTMQFATDSVNIITSAIETVGFDKKDLKTTSFNVRTHYESYRDKDNNYKSRFDGYICEQGLKLEFDFDPKVMSNVLSAIAKATVNPKLNIQFSVKDKAAVSEELLIQATENARKKAEILSKASGVDLGNLINIDYNWGELHLYSPTRYDMEDRCMVMESSCAPEIEPDDISISDTVTFVWEIK
ncbi:SIMPL domain-containing protein [Tissierella sp.]|uniref:SIMPL domain-containing protein n=1 Tax=Tissierella sp. TaxID=41274 RepID=UPI0028585D7F|nr:SIMPL domain-containing protein [Tissierella sp.]MDR7855930.1 SIMPL domain-containing protein [Tissierella sp.]